MMTLIRSYEPLFVERIDVYVIRLSTACQIMKPRFYYASWHTSSSVTMIATSLSHSVAHMIAESIAETRFDCYDWRALRPISNQP